MDRIRHAEKEALCKVKGIADKDVERGVALQLYLYDFKRLGGRPDAEKVLDRDKDMQFAAGPWGKRVVIY